MEKIQKFYSMLLILFLFTSENGMAQSYYIGDVNRDKIVDISDIVAVINTIAGEQTYTGTADVNGDKAIDISDIVAIINIIAMGDPAVVEGLCPDSNHPHAIDLGLDVKFACCNVGANTPFEIGGYYAWGETWTKKVYDWDSYKYGSQEFPKWIGRNIVNTEYDVAHVTWGGDWHMPTNTELEQLIKKCTCDYVNLEGVNGFKMTASNGNAIFLPAGGFKQNNGIVNLDKLFRCWTTLIGNMPNDPHSNHAYAQFLGIDYSGIKALSSNRRFLGFNVRAVQ